MIEEQIFYDFEAFEINKEDVENETNFIDPHARLTSILTNPKDGIRFTCYFNLNKRQQYRAKRIIIEYPPYDFHKKHSSYDFYFPDKITLQCFEEIEHE